MLDNAADIRAFDRRIALVNALEYVIGADVEGQLAEFGVADGGSASLICRTLRDFRGTYGYLGDAVVRRELHLFDSFEGFPLPSSEADVASPHVRKGVWREGSERATKSPRQLHDELAAILGHDDLRLYPGWFSDTLAHIPADLRFAFVHVDCDLYSSASEVLDALFSRGRVAEGCALLFDDFNCNRADPAFGERRAWAEAVDRYAVQYSPWRSYAWHGQAFLVHSYRRGTTA